MSLRELAVSALLVFGVVVTLFSCLGVLVMRDAYDRLHYTTPAAVVAPVAIAAAVVLEERLSAAGVKAVLVAVVLAVALWRHCTGHPVRGVFRVVPFPSEADDARSAGRRALVTVLVSATPNTVVVGVEGGEGEMLVHQLVPEPGSPVPPSMLEDGGEPDG